MAETMSQWAIPGMNSKESAQYRKLVKDKKKTDSKGTEYKKSKPWGGKGPANKSAGGSKGSFGQGTFDGGQNQSFQSFMAAANVMQQHGFDPFGSGQGRANNGPRNFDYAGPKNNFKGNNYQGGGRGPAQQGGNAGQGAGANNNG